jgi:hypothetical protein
MGNIKEVNPANLGLKGPLLLSGFFETVLQQHFWTPDGIFDGDLKDMLWRPDDTITGTTGTRIYIAQTLTPKQLQSNFRPAILITRGNWERTKVAMYDRKGMGDIVYGDKVSRWDGTHTFNCLAKTYASVEVLAHEVATFFEVYGQILATQICLEELFVTKISAPVLVAAENTEMYSVTISVNYYHHNQWSLGQLRPKIRHIRPLITVQDYEGRFEPKTTLTSLEYNDSL